MNWNAARMTILAVAVVATLGAFGAFLLLGGADDDRADSAPTASAPTATDDALTIDPQTSTGTAPQTTETPTATASPACEDATTRYNENGDQGDSLLPDCGQTPVTKAEEKDEGLSLACGGRYPVILYKSTTSGAKTSICGRDAVGDRFRVVIKPDGQDTLDLDGTYAWRQDAYVAEHEGTRYVLHAVDGMLEVTKDGRTTRQESSDWISLENEGDDS